MTHLKLGIVDAHYNWHRAFLVLSIFHAFHDWTQAFLIFDHIDTQNNSYLSLLILAQLILGFFIEKSPLKALNLWFYWIHSRTMHWGIINQYQMMTAAPNFWLCSIPEIPNMRYAKVNHVIYQSCSISDMWNMNNSKNQKWLMPMIPNINTCKCQSFWRSEMSSFNNFNVNCAQYQ